jgi:hypothetical protein
VALARSTSSFCAARGNASPAARKPAAPSTRTRFAAAGGGRGTNAGWLAPLPSWAWH